MKYSSAFEIVCAALCVIFSSNIHAETAAPAFNSTPIVTGVPQVGSIVTIVVAASDPQNLPLTVAYTYGDGASDALGKHVYSAAGVYPIAVTISNGSASATAALSVTCTEVANLWIKQQSIKAGAAGKQSWHAQYIYNSDRTLAHIFNPVKDDLIASLGTIPLIQISSSATGAQKFVGASPMYAFKSAKGAKPALSVTLNESSQTIMINATSETFSDTVPGTFHNLVQMGPYSYSIDQFLDTKGKFTANSGYRSAAFVVSNGSIKLSSKAGMDSAMFTLLLGDPAFVFPGASSNKTVRVRLTNILNQIVFDKDLTAGITSKAGKLKSGKDLLTPAGSFSYDSVKGDMTFKLTKATMAGFFTTSEEFVRVDVTIGSQTYTTHVTLFAAKAGSYSTAMPKKYTNFIPGRVFDTEAPAVISTVPANQAQNVPLNRQISVSFSEAMNPATINSTTFTLQQGSTAVSGSVAYTGTTATFTPASNLAPSTVYVATVTTGATDLAGNALVCNAVWTFTTGTATDTTPPTVVSTIPANLATGVAINSKISAAFSEPMDPLTLTPATFILMQGATAIAGTVTYAAINSNAVFTPSSNLALNSLYTATVTTGAKDQAGNAMAANYSWNFTTGSTADTLSPNVISTNPTDKATNVALNHTVNATFDKAMDPSTINTTNFTLVGPGNGSNSITGTISYDTVHQIATFTPASDLAASSQFIATVTNGVKDLSGNALANNKVWTFTTGSQKAIVPVVLGTAASFGTFGGGAGMTSQGLFTVVNGDISTTGASTTVTGFHDSVGDIYTETPLNKGQVNGRIYTAPPTPGGAGVGGNASTFAIATKGASDAQTAYNNLLPASIPGGTDPGAGQLGGLTLPPGVYQAASATFLITGSDLTLDAQGDSNAVWVFQMAASLTVGGPGAPRSVILINGAQAKNVFWQVGSSATINAAGGGTMVGTIIASSGVTFSTAGNVTLVTLNGRALGLNASTTLVNTVINVPAP